MQQWLPTAASGHAGMLDRVLLSVHAHMLLIFVAWMAVFVIALIKFRSGASPTARQEGARGMWPFIAIGAVVVLSLIHI